MIKNYFALFNLPESYALNSDVLEQAYLEKQQRCHPDHVAGEDALTQLQALQQTATVNEAYETLMHPVKRALHLLALQGVQNVLENTTLSSDQMAQQFELRARLVEEVDALSTLKNDVDVLWEETVTSFEKEATPEAALQMQFLYKLKQELRQKAR